MQNDLGAALPIETASDVNIAVEVIHNNILTGYGIVPCKIFCRKSETRAEIYQRFHILCNSNTTDNEGWYICVYFKDVVLNI